MHGAMGAWELGPGEVEGRYTGNSAIPQYLSYWRDNTCRTVVLEAWHGWSVAEALAVCADGYEGICVQQEETTRASWRHGAPRLMGPMLLSTAHKRLCLVKGNPHGVGVSYLIPLAPPHPCSGVSSSVC